MNRKLFFVLIALAIALAFGASKPALAQRPVGNGNGANPCDGPAAASNPHCQSEDVVVEEATGETTNEVTEAGSETTQEDCPGHSCDPLPPQSPACDGPAADKNPHCTSDGETGEGETETETETGETGEGETGEGEEVNEVGEGNPNPGDSGCELPQKSKKGFYPLYQPCPSDVAINVTGDITITVITTGEVVYRWEDYPYSDYAPGGDPCNDCCDTEFILGTVFGAGALLVGFLLCLVFLALVGVLLLLIFLTKRILSEFTRKP